MDDLLLRGGIIAGTPQDLAIQQGRISQIAPRILTPALQTLDVAGKLVLPGFVESHIHPDKAFVADRAPGLSRGGPTPQLLVAELKKAFTVEDIYERARVIDKLREAGIHAISLPATERKDVVLILLYWMRQARRRRLQSSQRNFGCSSPDVSSRGTLAPPKCVSMQRDMHSRSLKAPHPGLCPPGREHSLLIDGGG